MRLSHWDFRPKHRRRFVASGASDGRPGSRRKPAFRILLLLSLGLLVYFKYDDVVQSGWVDKLRQPGELWKEAKARLPGSGEASPPSAAPVFSPDSTSQEWSCASSAQDSCLASWAALPAAERGALRALILKAGLDIGLPAPSGFHALYLRTPAVETGAAEEPAWKLARLVLETGDRSVTLAPMPVPGGGEAWCTVDAAGPANCLAKPVPAPPLSGPSGRLATRPPEISFPGPAGRALRPILPGRIVAWPAGPGWVKVHHGGGLFSYYAGVASPAPGVSVGSKLGAGATLGFTAGPDTLIPAAPGPVGDARTEGTVAEAAPGEPLRVRVEKDGSPLDPYAFLGLDEATDTVGVAHGR